MGRRKPSDKPVMVNLTFVLPPLKRDCPPFATARGDLDNYAKAALDGLNGVVYADDKQVVELVANKVWPDETGFLGVKEIGTYVDVTIWDAS